MTRIDDLLDVIVSTQQQEPAAPTAAKDIEEFERRSRYPLPADMRAFYVRIAQASIFEDCQVLPLRALQRTGVRYWDDEWADSEPASWFAFCDAADGDFVAIDLSAAPDGSNAILDCDHESHSPRNVIATSFSEFLQRTLSSPDKRYHLGKTWPQLTVPYRPPASYLRREYQKWSLDPELGPRTCVADGCARLRVALSGHCRRHHFEAIQGQPYPFDD